MIEVVQLIGIALVVAGAFLFIRVDLAQRAAAKNDTVREDPRA
jgi:hypothetical protein